MDARILVTMEHPEEMKLITDTLEHVGHCVTKSATFHAAMEILRSADFDMIVCDVHLQNGGNVFDFLRWTKGDPHMKAIPFVCFSAEPPEISKYLSDGVRTAARALGAASYVTMEHFDAHAFRQEIEWLLPLDRAGSYYAEPCKSAGNGDGDGRKQADVLLERRM
jgi:CheY-like chemotaxis protein